MISVVLLSVVLLWGCSVSDPISPDGGTDRQDLTQAPQSTLLSSDNYLWGVWEIVIDPVSLEIAINQIRQGTFHANVRQFLEEGPCTSCLSIMPPIIPQTYGMDVTLALTHPFPGLDQYTGFDVRGIVLLEGTYDFDIFSMLTTRAGAGDPSVLNHDGWTTAFNAIDYTLPGILGYSPGTMIPPPPTWSNPDNNLNAFKAFYSAGQSEDDGGRRAFFAGDAVSRTYEIQFNTAEPLRFWYAVDASWEEPVGSAPWELDDFEPDANCPEAYRFDFSVVSGELWPSGGVVTIGVDIYDHQGWSEPWSVAYASPECQDGAGVIIAPPDTIMGDIAHWEFGISNVNSGLDPAMGAELMVICGNPDDDPLTGPIDGVGRFTIPVGDGPPEDPIVISIDPDTGEQDSGVDNAEVVGENFQDGCTLHLQKAGQVDIDAMDIVFVDSQHIYGDFDLTGAALGFWNVVVINPGGGTGTLVDGFEVLEYTGCNSNLHNNYLGTGDFSGGTHMGAYDALFVHNTGTDADGEFLGYISGFAGTVVTTYIIDTLTPLDGHGLTGSGWGNPHIGSWPVPLSIDVSEENGQFFIAWNDIPSIIEVWDTTSGKLAGQTDASSNGTIFCLDTDGSGGFWNAYFPEMGFAPGIKHFTPDGPQPGTLIEKTADSFLLPETWGTPTEVIVIPGDTLLVLTGAQQGKIRAYDISSSPPVYTGSLNGIFSGDLDWGTYPSRPCDMAVDWSDIDVAHCRIVISGNLISGGIELVKIDEDLNVLAGPTALSTNHYHSMDINPDTGDIALWPRQDSPGPGEYALIEQPVGW